MLEIRLGDRLIRGIQAGITEQGTLRLEVAGETLIFNSGEVSLRLAQRLSQQEPGLARIFWRSASR
ncbi:MAG: hypothetical protein KAX51_10820 [Chromatiaceae bacterium]|nr:hypothetical protein [Chromatiaceae bacterium]MBP9603706.1 hypothetical protein [Chromatiaceae bacterium]